MNFKFEHSFLISKIDSDQKHIASWAAFHLLKYYPDHFDQDFPCLLDSPYSIIKEAALIKAIHQLAGVHLNKVYKIFRESDGNLKNLAGFYLALAPNDLTKKVISEWFEEQIHQTGFVYEDLFFSCLSFVELDSKKHTKILFEKLKAHKNNVLTSEVFFKVLVDRCDSKRQYTQLLDFYFFTRKVYPQIATFEKFLELIHAQDMTNSVMNIKNINYTAHTLYQEIYDKLSIEFNGDQKVKKNLDDLGVINKLFQNIDQLDQNKFDGIINFFSMWLKKSSKQEDALIIKKNLWTIEYFEENKAQFFLTVPKIIKMEFAYILASKAITEIYKNVSFWRRDKNSDKQIKHYLQKGLLSPKHQKQLIKKYFGEEISWNEEEVVFKDQKSIQLTDHKNKILFAFLDGRYKGVNIPWYNYFNSELDDFPIVLDCLQKVYQVNFQFYLQKNDDDSLRFVLKLLIKKFNAPLFTLVKDSFDHLYNQHQDLLFQIIHLYPEKSFYTVLKAKVIKGDEEIIKLLAFVASIHQIKLDRSLTSKVSLIKNKTPNALRLGCKCDHCAEKQYHTVQNIYINPDAVHHERKLLNSDIWVAETITCKKCKTTIHQYFEAYELEQLRKDSLLVLKTKVLNCINDKTINSSMTFVSFPTLDSIAYNPDDFLKRIDQLKQKGDEESLEMSNIMRLQLSHLYESLNLWEKNIKLLSSDIPKKYTIQFSTKLGISWYKLSDWINGEKYFKQALRLSQSKITTFEENRYLKQAQHFLNEVQSPLKKRALLKIVDGKK